MEPAQEELTNIDVRSKPSLVDPQTTSLESWLAERGHKSFRAAQIRKWLLVGRATTFDAMTDLPKDPRTALSQDFSILTSHPSRHQIADDGTEKLLIDLADGGQVECVLLRDGIRRTICVSSQVGCGMGCVFCASGLDGVVRNLTAGEILEQLLHVQRLLPADERLSHVVMMGMGEPLANLERVVEALDVAADPQGLGISPRRITISTVGLPAAMDRLAEMDRPFNLAVSLHAPNDLIRTHIVPTNTKTGLHEIIAAADRYLRASGRRLTFEYVLLAGINDRDEHAAELANLLRGRIAFLNVIPYNPVAGLPYRTPTAGAIRRFRQILLDSGIDVKFRQRKGDSIQAACGQLRRNPALAAELPALNGVHLDGENP